MTDKITVQSVSDIITSKADRKYFTFGDIGQKRYVCFIPQLREYCKVGSEIEVDLTLGKTPDDSPRLDMIYVNGKPVISVEKKTAGRSYGKSDKELLQIRQLAEAQNRSIQAQTALNRAVDLFVSAGVNPILADDNYPSISKLTDNIGQYAREFYQLLQSLTQISEAQVIHKEVKDVPNKVSTEETGQGSGEFDKEWWREALDRLDNNAWVAEQIKLPKGQHLGEAIKKMDSGKRALLKNSVELALAYKEKSE